MMLILKNFIKSLTKLKIKAPRKEIKSLITPLKKTKNLPSEMPTILLKKEKKHLRTKMIRIKMKRSLRK